MKRRAGFTAIELVVVLAVLITLAVIILPQVANRAADATATAALSSTSTLADAIAQFKADTRRYPGRLEWLVSTAGTPTDVCGGAIPAGLLARWSGPYIQQHIPSTGLPAGDARVLNALGRADPSTTTVSNLVIRVAEVTREHADAIEREIDGNANLGGGTIRWVDAPGAAADTLLYYLPIRGC